MKNSFVGYKLFTLSAREFVRDDCFTLSLSISFVFLLSIIPFATFFEYQDKVALSPDFRNCFLSAMDGGT